jgi:2-keto-4-pentenoate hydratase/2-oxohepta-3-ene-1,7-dioic acid hydratase in catechol pathway
MRLFAFDNAGVPTMAASEGDILRPLAPLADFYADPDGYLGAEGGDPIDRADVVAVPPVPTTAKILCIGLNYPLHIAETNSERPAHPNLFARWWSTLSVDGGSCAVPPGEEGLDFEAELAVIIGRELHAVDEADAMAGVLGYTCFNDISARRFQRATSQWALGKNADDSAPIGPVIVTADELGDPMGLRIGSRLNGETMQDSTTDQMIFDIAETIAYITQALTLRPGDVIATGTPDGVGSRREPPLLMTAGDTIEVDIEGIGILTTHIE